MFNNTNKQKGGIKWIVMLVIGLVLASYFFDFSVQDAVENERTQENIEYVKDESKGFYNKHLKDKVEYFWNEIFVSLIWNSFTDNMTRIKNGEATILETSAPNSNDLVAPTIEILDSKTDPEQGSDVIKN